MNEKNEKNAKKQLIEKVKKVTNILVTVARDPTVDQLTAALALTITLDKIKKRATAVFSGEIPPVMNFLEPEKTFEDNADSLRDFIILLDKDKADRLKMKTDGDVVKILVTPYRAKITSDDISFAEGDFNVELVIAIGVNKKSDLDEALSAHGRIFHDAVVATLNISKSKDSFGSINWKSTELSSYSEMVVDLINDLSEEGSVLDEQVSTALLTGIVATTDQFRNEKTTSSIMKLSSELMAHGANQQLIVSEIAASNDEVPLDDSNNELNTETETEAESEIEAKPEVEAEATTEKSETQDTDEKILEIAKPAENSFDATEAPEDAQEEPIREALENTPELEVIEDPQVEAANNTRLPSRDDRLRTARNNLLDERNNDALGIAHSQLLETELDRDKNQPTASEVSMIETSPPITQVEPDTAELDNLVAQSGANNVNDDLQNFNDSLIDQPPTTVQVDPLNPSVHDVKPEDPGIIQQPSFMNKSSVLTMYADTPPPPKPLTINSAPELPPMPNPVPSANPEAALSIQDSTTARLSSANQSSPEITRSFGVPLPPPPPLPIPDLTNELPPVMPVAPPLPPPPPLNHDLQPQVALQQDPVQTPIIQGSDNSAIFPPTATNPDPNDLNQFQIPN